MVTEDKPYISLGSFRLSKVIFQPFLVAALVMILVLLTTVGRHLYSEHHRVTTAEALGEMVDACEQSSLRGVSYSDSTLAVHRIEGVGEDGSLKWENTLDVFWLVGDTLKRTRLTEEQLSRLDLELSDRWGMRLSDEELQKVVALAEGETLADSIAYFRTDFKDEAIRLEVRSNHVDGSQERMLHLAE